MHIEVIIEVPQGSRNKYEMDHSAGRIRLDRMLFTSTRYPADYGSFPTPWPRTATRWMRTASTSLWITSGRLLAASGAGRIRTACPAASRRSPAAGCT